MIRITRVFLTYLILVSPLSNAGDNSGLPMLGDASSGTVSPEKEHRLGRAWLRALRARTPVEYDPLVNDYVNFLLYRLAEHSQLNDRRLELVMINSPVLNAFAVPGGIVGVNGGLFLYAQSENEFASVLAHELAHLSQRHYSRNVEAAKRNRIPNMAALLAGIVLAATVGGDAGLAALTTSQAVILEGQLRFSRQNEQEADRIGLLTLVDAKMDPNAMASMFERMLASQRLLGSRPPEFLLSHPVTESRVADARSRAKQYSTSRFNTPDNLEYYLMRNRIRLGFEQSPGDAINTFRAELDDENPLRAKAARYALALAYHRADRIIDANQSLESILKKDANRISYISAYAEINTEPRQLAKVEALLRKHLLLNPDNYALSMQLAKNLRLQNRFKDSVAVLQNQALIRPNDPHIWYELAETQGLYGDILGVHQARAEYFILVGNMDRALDQLGYASKKVGDNYQVTAKLNQRRKDVYRYKEELKQF